MRFGVSTHLFHDRRLERDHLALVAGHGFEAIELFATRSHFDYHDPEAIAHLREWLAETGLTMGSVHAPITTTFGQGDVWAPEFSTASGDKAARQAAVHEAEAALRLAHVIPYGVLVLHLGTPDGRAGVDDNQRAAALRSLGEIGEAAAAVDVQVAVEVIPNKLSDAASLARLIDQEVEADHVGVCLDFGHAHLRGDVADAIETVAEHLIAIHVHDNHGREDEHLVPGRGTIDWPSALITMQKIGFAGTWLLELANTGSPDAVLQEARRARARLERALAES
jgi:sugar phosphate isomerase/epimerase